MRTEGKGRVGVCNSVAQSVIERQRNKHPTHVFTYRSHPIEPMNNNGWRKARERAKLDDLHVHDLRHTVGMRLREAGVAEETIADILWHSRRGMTAHYSVAQLIEIHQALVKIEDETHRWNVSLISLARDRIVGQVPQPRENRLNAMSCK